jgi:hypothetical protein
VEVALLAGEGGDRLRRGAHELRLGHRRVGEARAVERHITEREERRQQGLGAERVELEADGELLRRRRRFVQRLEDAQHHRRCHRASRDQAGERVEKRVWLAAIEHGAAE